MLLLKLGWEVGLWVDEDWLEGELDCQRGIFPKSYITIVVDCPTLFPELDVAVVTGSQYRVVFSFTGEREGDLGGEQRLGGQPAKGGR